MDSRLEYRDAFNIQRDTRSTTAVFHLWGHVDELISRIDLSTSLTRGVLQSFDTTKYILSKIPFKHVPALHERSELLKYAKETGSVFCEVEVKCGPWKPTLEEKTIPFCKFFESNRSAKVLMISSKGVHMVNAMLNVYREHKEKITRQGIAMFHVLHFTEDEIKRSIAHQHVTKYKHLVEISKRQLPTKAQIASTTKAAVDKCVEREHIRNICQNVVLYDELSHFVGKVSDSPYWTRRRETVRLLKEKLVDDTINGLRTSLSEEISKNLLKEIISRIKEGLDDSYALEMAKISISTDVWVLSADFVAALQNVFANLYKNIKDFLYYVFEVVRLAMFALNVNDEGWRNKVADELYVETKKIEGKLVQEISDLLTPMVAETEKDLSEILALCDWVTPAENVMEDLNTRMQINETLSTKMFPNSVVEIRFGMENQEHVVCVFMDNGREEEEMGCIDIINSADSVYKVKFLNITGKNDESLNISDFKSRYNVHFVDKAVREKINKAITEEETRLFTIHSNLVGIGFSSFLSTKQGVLRIPCVVFYCLHKGVIPLGELEFPKNLRGVRCDVREGRISLGGDCLNCVSPNHGCSIGRENDKSAGSIGFFVSQRDTGDSGFLTAAHVALDESTRLQNLDMSLTSRYVNPRNPQIIVHPSFGDLKRNIPIGAVTKAIFGNISSRGIDAAFVKTYKSMTQTGSFPEYNILPFSRDLSSDDIFPQRVIKKGRATDITVGLLTSCTYSFQKEIRKGSGQFIMFQNCCTIESDIADGNDFFMLGDSGSGIFAINNQNLRPIALAIGVNNASDGDVAIALPLGYILSELNLSM